LTFAPLPFLILTKTEPSGKIRREQDVEVVWNILNTYYGGSVTEFLEGERVAINAVSKCIDPGHFRSGLLESLSRS
jgi:hypothetical protein